MRKIHMNVLIIASLVGYYSCMSPLKKEQYIRNEMARIEKEYNVYTSFSWDSSLTDSAKTAAWKKMTRREMKKIIDEQERFAASFPDSSFSPPSIWDPNSTKIDTAINVIRNKNKIKYFRKHHLSTKGYVFIE